ncbi:MAG: hypothetical protein ACREQF_10950 [Candidatus Binataceae bacterium]
MKFKVRSIVPLAIACAMMILTAAPVAAQCSRRVLQPYSLRSAQADSAGDEEREVTPSQLERYVSVYRAMQKDRSLTVEQAAKNAGFSLAQFRDLESRVERNDSLRERARRALRPQNTAETPDTEGD